MYDFDNDNEFNSIDENQEYDMDFNTFENNDLELDIEND